MELEHPHCAGVSSGAASSGAASSSTPSDCVSVASVMVTPPPRNPLALENTPTPLDESWRCYTDKNNQISMHMHVCIGTLDYCCLLQAAYFINPSISCSQDPRVRLRKLVELEMHLQNLARLEALAETISKPMDPPANGISAL